jgi:AraC-like DNA-binding protein
MPGDRELAALRFYDQSHLTREFHHFVGMTPAQFQQTSTPILTISIEARQTRKDEDQQRLQSGTKPPWRG